MAAMSSAEVVLSPPSDPVREVGCGFAGHEVLGPPLAAAVPQRGMKPALAHWQAPVTASICVMHSSASLLLMDVLMT